MSQLTTAITELKAAALGILAADQDAEEKWLNAAARLEVACFAIAPAAEADEQAAVKAALTAGEDIWHGGV